MNHSPGTLGPAGAVAVMASGVMSVFAAIGLVLAMLGVYETWSTLALTSITVGAVALATRARWPQGHPVIDTDSWWWDAATAVGAIALAIWSLPRTAQHLIIDRDPGSYGTTARWLSRTGQLWIDAPSGVLGSVAGLDRASPAVYDMGRGRLEFQFSHGASTVMAAALDLAGARALFAITLVVGVIGLLAVFALMRWVGIAPAIATAMTLLLGVSQPWIYLTRDTFSEPYAVACGMSGVLLLVIGWDRRHAALQWFAGMLVGSVVLFRIDGLLYLTALAAAGAVIVSLSGCTADAWRPLVGAAVPAAIGATDHVWFSGDYVSGLAGSTRLLAAALVASTAALAATTWARSRRPASFRTGPPEPVRGADVGRLVLPVAVTLTVGLLWLIRPLIQTSRLGKTYANTEAFQARQGLQVDGTRGYAELSVAQIGWYFGPVMVALAAIGAGLFVHSSMRRRNMSQLALSAFCVVAVPLYLVRPRITPDHPWAMRRQFPFVNPITLLLAAFSITVVLQMARSRGRASLGAALSIVLVALIAVPTVGATLPLNELSTQRGSQPAVEQLCERIGDDASVVVLDRVRLTMTIRAWCGNEAAFAAPEVAVDVTRAAQEQCAPLVFAAADPAFLDAVISLQPAPFGERSTVTVEIGPNVVEAVERAADEVVAEIFTMTVAALELGPGCSGG